MITSETRTNPVRDLIDNLAMRIADSETRKNYNFLRNAGIIESSYWQYFLAEKLLKRKVDCRY